MDLRQTSAYGDYLKRIGWLLYRDPKTKSVVYVRTLPGTPFSVLKIQRPTVLPNYSFIRSLVRKHRAIQINIEPLNDAQVPFMVAWRLKRQTIPFLPSNTILLDLKKPLRSLLVLMKPKIRYNLKVAEKKGVLVKTIQGDTLLQDQQLFNDLFAMQRQNAKRLGIFVLPKKWFRHQVEAMRKNCFATMAYWNNRLVAATFYMTSETTVYYSHNGSLPEGRRMFAPTACVWAGVLEGKSRGLKEFDFEGIYDFRSHVIRWQGFTRFKKGFGGEEHFFPGLYSKWVWPF